MARECNDTKGRTDADEMERDGLGIDEMGGDGLEWDELGEGELERGDLE